MGEECFDLQTLADIDNQADAAAAASDSGMGTTGYLILTLTLLVLCICSVIGAVFWWKRRENENNGMKSPINFGAKFMKNEKTQIAKEDLFGDALNKANRPKGMAPRPPTAPSH